MALSSCAPSGPADNAGSGKWVSEGQIVISRSLPDISSPGPMQSMMGFIPVIGSHTGVWLSIDRNTEIVSLMEGSRQISNARAEGTKNLTAGSYQVLHMQRNPLWYAPDQYFSHRNQPVPPQGDKARFRRGALGDYAIFINKDTPIHSGPVWSEDVGGIRLLETDLSKLYYQLQIGSIIEIR